MLQILDISDCKIAYFSKASFSKLPGLEILDISHNSLYQLEPNIIKPLKNLKALISTNNTWRCNEVMFNLGSYCKKRDIRYTDECPRYENVNSNQFERMVKLEDNDVHKPTPKNLWLYNNDDAHPENETKVIEVCKTNNSSKHITLLAKVFELSPIMTITIPFICGIMAGLILGCSVQIKSAKKAPKISHPKTDYLRLNSYTRNTLSYPHTPLVEYCDTLGQSTPMVQRKI